MWGSIDDTGRNLARWLREVARGHKGDLSASAGESPDAVLKHLESRAGRKLRSSAAIDGFLRDLAAERTRAHKQGMHRGIVRGALLAALLAAAFLHYYYWTVNLEIASLPVVQVFGVTPARLVR